MRYRDYKIFAPNNWYHIYNRGNNKQPICLDEADYLNLIKRFKIALNLLPNPVYRSLNIPPLPANSFSICCYCLMPNHFHLCIRQNGQIPINRLITKVCTSYATYFNHKYKQVGHLFQDAFKAKLVENDAYLVQLSAYIHCNPENPFEYPYSSLPDVLGYRQGKLCDPSIILKYFDMNPQLYKKYIEDFNQSELEKISNLVFEE